MSLQRLTNDPGYRPIFNFGASCNLTVQFPRNRSRDTPRFVLEIATLILHPRFTKPQILPYLWTEQRETAAPHDAEALSQGYDQLEHHELPHIEPKPVSLPKTQGGCALTSENLTSAQSVLHVRRLLHE